MTKMFLRVDAAGPEGRGLSPTVHDPSDRSLAGAKAPRAYTAYTDPSGVFTVGVWACDAGTLAIDDLAIDEACYLSGAYRRLRQVHRTGLDGRQRAARAVAELDLHRVPRAV